MSGWFKEFSDSLSAAMADADRAPEILCPACGNSMTKGIGSGRLRSYRCWDMHCVGVEVSVENLCDASNWKAICDDAQQRMRARKEMLERNGAHSSLSPPKKNDRWCADCRAYHPPTDEHPICRLCSFGIHAPMPPDIYFNYRGWKFTPPFICMGCGIEVCFRQWAFSRSCGACDVSDSKTRRVLYLQCFAGPHEKLPTWNQEDGDIRQDHFLDPKDAPDYPVLRPSRISPVLAASAWARMRTGPSRRR